MLAGADHRDDLGRRVGKIDQIDVEARRHHLAHRPVAQPHHAGDHVALAGLEHAGVFGFRDDRTDFLVGHALFALGGLAEQHEDNLAGFVEDPDDRRRDLGNQHHRRCDGAGDSLGVFQRQLLWNKLADDQRQVGDSGDHQTDAGHIGPARWHALSDEPLAEAIAQSRPGNCARENPDQRDADLHRG